MPFRKSAKRTRNMFDPEKSLHSKKLAQNFLINRTLAARLIKSAGIGREDTVLDIGAGEGAITGELARVAGKVIALEKDQKLVARLKHSLAGTAHVRVIEQDFLAYPLPQESYKVFANPPFNITSQAIKKLVWALQSPQDAYLFTQKEAAERFCSIAKEYEFSLMVKPWFTFQITHRFSRSDFVPRPSVDVVLLHLHLRQKELLPRSEEKLWQKFVHYGFSRQKKDLEANFKHVFTHEQWKRMSRDLQFSMHTLPIQIGTKQWLGLFRCFRDRVESSKQDLIRNFPFIY